MKIIIQILFMAVTVAFLISWGYIKKQKKQEELYSLLLKKCEKKILNGFKDKSSLSKTEIENIIKDTKASLFWSKSRAQIEDARLFSDTVIEFLLDQSVIQKDNRNRYQLLER
jgi:hypothetical protein